MLKYLFTAYYNDGNVYHQNADDVSLTDSKRSCFFDVDQSKLEKFLLKWTPPAGGVHLPQTYLVDLTDGHFEVNEAKFFLHDRDVPLTNMRIIFARRHAEHITLNVNTGDKVGRSSSPLKYLLGFQANLPDGKNVQFIISIE